VIVTLDDARRTTRLGSGSRTGHYIFLTHAMPDPPAGEM
jgi:hypothetical protein